MHSFIKISLLCLAIVVHTCALNAQDSYSDSLAYTLGIDLTGTRSTGILSRTTLRVGGKLHISKSRWELNDDLSYQFNKTNDRTLLDNWLNIASLRYHLGGNWNWFPIALYQYENNLIYRVQNRHRLGLGIGAFPYDKNGYQIRFTTGYFYENETYNGDTFINSELIDPTRKNNSGWFHLTNKIPIAKKGALILDVWYFQSFEEREDFAISILPKLQMKINQHFSFLVRYDWRFENVFLEPLTDFNDLLLFGLNVNFGN